MTIKNMKHYVVKDISFIYVTYIDYEIVWVYYVCYYFFNHKVLLEIELEIHSKEMSNPRNIYTLVHTAIYVDIRCTNNMKT